MMTDELLTKVYEEVKIIRTDLEALKEVKALKEVLIPEVELTEEELESLEDGLQELKEGKVRDWERIREEV